MIDIAIVVVGLVVVASLSAIVGAELQDRVHEDQRRRMAARRRELNAAFREVRHRRDASACDRGQ